MINEWYIPRRCAREVPTLGFSFPSPKVAFLPGGSPDASCAQPAGVHPATLVGILSLISRGGEGILYWGALIGELSTNALCLAGVEVQF